MPTNGDGTREPELNEAELIYDWNSVEKVAPLSPKRKFTFFDETLRDGIQSPSVVDPKIEDKVLFTQIADDLGIHHIDIGLPGAGPRAVDDCTTLATYIRDNKLKIKPACAARTHVNDVQAVVDISQRVGIAIEVMAFIGSSPIRAYAEDWNLDLLLKRSAEAIDLAFKNDLPVTYVTEDTTRSRPEVLDRLFRNAVDHGAHRLCLCDTVGHATPDGIHNLLRFTRNLLNGMGRADVGIDWHGHNDRGLGVVNTIFAIEFGADRAHGTALGLGELPDHDLSKLLLWCKIASRACHVAIPPQYPLAGSDAFRTATGVHAAAIIKAEKKGHHWLADRIYSGVPAGMFGREQEIEIGHYSGESNVVYWLQKRGHTPSKELVSTILGAAKRGNRVLTDDEVNQIIKEFQAGKERSTTRQPSV